MLLACHKKSYLICVEFSKHYVIFVEIFFSMYKTETANRAETAALKMNRYYVIFRKFNTSNGFFRTCQPATLILNIFWGHKYLTKYLLFLKFSYYSNFRETAIFWNTTIFVHFCNFLIFRKHWPSIYVWSFVC